MLNVVEVDDVVVFDRADAVADSVSLRDTKHIEIFLKRQLNNTPQAAYDGVDTDRRMVSDLPCYCEGIS
jgi:hypothetical protein